MSEDFAGNSFETGGNLNLTPSIHTFGDSGSPLDTREQYSLTPGGSSSFNLSLDEKSVNADVEELNSTSEILPTSALLGINGQSLYKTADATAPNQEATLPQNWDSLTAFGEPMFETGVFTVGPKGEVGVDFLLDGGKYQGELAIFSLKGIDQFELGSEDFIQEAARRALTNSDLGYVVINDLTEGARFHGSFAWEGDSNSGEYQGVKTFLMRPGDQFGVMLVPNGTVQQVFDNPAVDGATRPLFSLATANPNDAFHVGQIADVTGEGNTFVMEDLRVDGWIDKDYNDIIFQVRGATARAVQLDEVIKPAYDWRGSDLGQALIAYAKPYVTSAEPIQSDPVVSPPINSDLTSAKPIDAVPIVSPPLETNPVVTPPVNSDVTSAKPIDAVPIVSPPLETNPVVTPPVDSKSVSFDFPASNQPLVGVIDTGFSGNNPDIDYSRIILGRDRISNENNPLLQPGEGNEHGTHVLGIIAATQNNGIGIDGVNDKAPIWLGRAVGSGQWAESLVEFVDAAKASGKPNAVVNLSLDLTQVNPDGSITTRYEFTPQERAAIEYARQNQVLIVVAAGNDGDVMSILGQASQEFDNIITVGAADGLDRAPYSSYGYGLDILARGGTTENPLLSTTGNDVGTMAGTSLAAAHVTGAVSQVWAANPQLSYRQVIDTLKRTATDLNLPGWDAATGAGLLNLAAAVFLAKMLVPEDNATPAIDIPSTWSGEGKVTPTERAAEIYPSNFSGTVISVGVNTRVRSGPGTNYAIVGQRSPGAVVNFDAWTRGQFISYSALGTADDRWYRIAGTQNQWISAALISGGPSSTPTPQPQPQPGGSYYPEFASLTDAQWNEYTKDNTRFDVGWPDYRDERSLTPESIRNIYTDLSNALFGRRYPATAGYLLDPGYRSGIGIWHSGFDLLAPQGTPVKAVVGGTIVRGIQDINGNYFIGVRGDDGKLWIYGHLGSVAVPGGRIEAGQVIGNIGSAGHLHLEVQRGPFYRGSQSSNLDVVRNATLNPIKSFWELTNRNSGGGSLPPTQPSGRRPYIIKSGDTLSGIAQRELGNGNRWREITKADGGTFTDAEARRLQVGQTVYLPITYTSGSGTPVGTPPSSTPGVNSNINWVNFRGTVGPSVGVNLRNSTRFSDRSPNNEPYNKRLEFDGWTYGETVTDLWLGTPDARWFKVKGTNFWVPSAYIYGNPPNSSPMPGSGAVGNVDIIAEPIHSPSDPNGTLGTAENWDVFSDRSKDEPNFIGYNGDQNDFIRFSVANNRTNVNLRLSGLSADADLQLIRDVNNNGRVDPGEVLGESLNPGISVDSVSRILDAGDYFIRVYPGVSNAKTSYNLELKSVRLAGDIQNGDRFYSAGASLWRYNSKGKMENQEEIKSNAAIESNKDTIVVIHGWNPEGKNKTIDDDATMSDLAKAAAQAYPDRQVLVLDWKSPANHWKDDVWYSDLEIKNPHHTAGAIRPVATWAKNTLEAIGLTANRISLFGHSLGSYVSAEIGRMFEKVNSIVALDPAAKGTWGGSEKYDIDGNTSGSQTIPLLFRHVANKSVAFVASDEKEGWAGDNDRAATANDSFIVRFNGDGDAVEYHGGVVQVFTDMLGRGASKIESLSGYKTDSVANNGVSYTYSLGRNIHEAVITAKKENGTWKYNQTLFIPGSDSARWV